MSAWVVSKAHIDALVHLALVGATDSEPDHPGDPLRWQIDPNVRVWSRENTRELVTIAGAPCNYQPMTPDELGDMLVRECVRSVIGRYPDTLSGGTMPGPIDEYWSAPYEYPEGTAAIVPGVTAIVMVRTPGAQAPRVNSVAALKAIHCYGYQSCEHDEWGTSEAKSFCDALAGRLTHRLPGYDAAPWGIN